MQPNFLKSSLLTASLLLLTACTGLFDTDNTPTPKPLTQYTPDIKPHLAWTAKPTSGNGDERLKMSPGVGQAALFTASASGTVAATQKSNGQLLWKTELNKPITSGVGVGQGLVVVGSRHGHIVALSESTGQVLWTASFPNEIIAKPIIHQNKVIIKAIDGQLRALSTNDGHELWRFQQTEPSLVLHGSSSPLPMDQHLYIGFANGNLAKVGIQQGQFYWVQPMAEPSGAFAIQRMIDIDADPIAYRQHLYAATYQGRIASLDHTSGRVRWSHDISSYTGMTADENSVYITDATGYVWAFNANSGLVNWRQLDLEARILSGPASMGNYIVLGDKEGYLHWLNKRDGHLAAREFTGAAILASPIVENNTVYAQTANGSLVAYRLS